MTSLERTMLRVYRALARAFPDEFRQTYGRDLVDAAEDLVQDAARRGGWLHLLLLLPRLLADLLLRLLVEHWHDGLRDVRYAARMLLRAPGFTLAAVTCLAIGIGITTATFSHLRSSVFRELPGVRDAGGLVRLQKPTAFPYFEEIRDHGGQFASVAAYMAPVPMVISHDGAEPARVWGHLATPNYFDLLGTTAALGRTFGAAERTPGGAQVVVLSERLWRSRFGGDASLVGRSIRINGQPVTVIGVAPRGFLGASPTTAAADLWIPTTAPLAVAPELARLHDAHTAAFDVIGRLRPGVTARQAEAPLGTLVRDLERRYNDPAKDSQERRILLLPGGRMFAMRDEDIPRAIGFPLVLVSLVLVMACGNVANMLLARSAARRREIAVRLSLGAGPSRIFRQLLTESLLLAALGAAAGMAFAFWLLSALDSLKPLMPAYGYFEVHFDWMSLLAASLIAAGSGVLFGLAPAVRGSRQDIYGGLKPDAPPAARGRRAISLRNLLVFQQVTASVVLLLFTAFVVVGWQRSTGIDVGFDTAQLYLVSLDPVRDGYSLERTQAFFEKLPEQLRRLPGVRSASLAQTLPLAMSGREAMLSAKIDMADRANGAGGGTGGGKASLGTMRAERVGAGFFDTVGTTLLRGRAFTTRDESDDARVLIVNEAMAKQVWPGEDPVGRQVNLDEQSWQVIGVVGDIRSAFPLAPTLPAVYRPVTPSGFATPSRHGVTVAVRVTPGFDASTRLRHAIDAFDPDVTIFEVTRMADEVQEALFLARVSSIIYGGMGLFGLLLASVGLAGVTAHAVARRTREIGIRMALGAQRADVLRLVLRESGTIVAAGTLVGLAAALALTRALAAFVETMAETTHTSMSDPLLLLGGPALLAGLALLACYLPARRSTRINPVTALRSE